MVPCGRPRLPITKSLPLCVLEEKKHSLSSKILCSSLERVLNTPDERCNGGESKLGSRQVVAVDGLHKAKQLNYENHKMMRQLFMQVYCSGRSCGEIPNEARILKQSSPRAHW